MTDTTASTTDEFEAQLTESVDGFRQSPETVET
jgi:hypothetical protein